MIASPHYDAIIVVSFGGPENKDDVMPFLENVVRGRNIPRERLLEVAHHYQMFGGGSPINDQNRAMIAALRTELDARHIGLPIYWGNRNWHPFLADTLRKMRSDGIQHALAFFTSAYSSYSGCRQYREDIIRAQAEVGKGAPQVSLLRKFYNHPRFIAANIARVRDAYAKIPAERQADTPLIFTAHSIPMDMARNCDYEAQLQNTCALVAEAIEKPEWLLVYQSRSGSPTQKWLEPDICDTLREIRIANVTDVVVAPIGFISDHMEVLYDLDTEAQAICQEIGLNMSRAATVGTHPEFIGMIADLIVERTTDNPSRPALGVRGPSHDVCPENCCLSGHSRPATAAAH